MPILPGDLVVGLWVCRIIDVDSPGLFFVADRHDVVPVHVADQAERNRLVCANILIELLGFRGLGKLGSQNADDRSKGQAEARDRVAMGVLLTAENVSVQRSSL